jgi:hypothetical protein
VKGTKRDPEIEDINIYKKTPILSLTEMLMTTCLLQCLSVKKLTSTYGLQSTFTHQFCHPWLGACALKYYCCPHVRNRKIVINCQEEPWKGSQPNFSLSHCTTLLQWEADKMTSEVALSSKILPLCDPSSYAC